MTAATATGPETSSSPDVVVGIDTQKHPHMAVAPGANGGWLGNLKLGCQTLRLPGADPLDRCIQQQFGFRCGGNRLLRRRVLKGANLPVVEVNRPDRSTRRRIGKDDTIDTEAAARACIAGTASVIPKAGDALVEMIRML